jgi:hypothetical protein
MIFEAIAIGKVALEALQTVRGLLEEGKGIAEAGRDLGKFFDAKEKIEGRIASGKAGDEEFWELEKIRAAEKQFYEQMDWYGRAGLKDDYLRWQRTRKELKEKERKREEAKRLAKRKAIKNGLIITAGLIGVVLVVGVFIMMIMWAKKGG